MKIKYSFLIIILNLYVINAQVLDNSFGTNGKIFYENFGTPNNILMQNDGKLIISGTLNSQGIMYRINEDGSFDSSFGNDGKVIIDEPNFSKDVANAFAVQPDGKILYIHYGSNSSTQARLERLNVDGTVDAEFVGSWNYYLFSPKLLANGKITALCRPYETGLVAVVQYNNMGYIDTSFGINGFLSSTSTYNIFDYNNENESFIFSSFDEGYILNIFSNGIIGNSLRTNVYAAQQVSVYQNKYFVCGNGRVARVSQNMTFDVGFGNNGVSIYNLSPSTNNYRYGNTIFHEDGYISQLVLNTSANKILITSLTNTGYLHVNFGAYGTYSLPINDLGTLNFGKIVSKEQDKYYYTLLSGSSADKILLARISYLNLSTNEVNKNKVLFYPNPTKDIIYFSQDLKEISIIDISGRIISSKKEFSEKINVENLPYGNYIIKATDLQGKAITEKFIKK